MDKPYIALNNDMGGGIVSLFAYDHEVASKLTDLGQTIMRRVRSLSTGERELIAAWTSKCNECDFCFLSHKECAAELMGGEVIRTIFDKQNAEILSLRMRSLMIVATYVASLDREGLSKAIETAKGFATDEEIHDTVLVASFFCMCNRYVDSLGTTFRPGEPETGGIGLVKYGYKMGIRRFFKEVLPKLIRKWTRP